MAPKTPLPLPLPNSGPKLRNEEFATPADATDHLSRVGCRKNEWRDARYPAGGIRRTHFPPVAAWEPCTKARRDLSFRKAHAFGVAPKKGNGKLVRFVSRNVTNSKESDQIGQIGNVEACSCMFYIINIEYKSTGTRRLIVLT